MNLLNVVPPSSVALVEPQSCAASHLSHKQVNRLINSAKTPDEHFQLAQYLRQEARKNRDKEVHYLEDAWNYRLHPPRVDMYRSVPMSDAYRNWAGQAHQLALADERLASAHEQMALQLLHAK